MNLCFSHASLFDTTMNDDIFTATSAFSLAGVLAIAIVAYYASYTFLPKSAKWQDRCTFIWLVRMNLSNFEIDVLLLSGIRCFDSLYI